MTEQTLDYLTKTIETHQRDLKIYYKLLNGMPCCKKGNLSRPDIEIQPRRKNQIERKPYEQVS